MRFLSGIVTGMIATFLVITTWPADLEGTWQRLIASVQTAPPEMVQEPAVPAAVVVIPAPPLIEEMPEVELPPEPVPLYGTEAVWQPFERQASASGFARRLSAQLERPFTVRRDGPGRYLVVFDFVDEADRLSVHQRLAALGTVASR